MKKSKVAHTPNTKLGMGDSYGSGIRNKVGRIRQVYTPGHNPVPKKGVNKAPKSLA